MKKVALVGNMNNNFFSLIRYLKDKNIQAELFLLNNEMGHFCPNVIRMICLIGLTRTH